MTDSAPKGPDRNKDGDPLTMTQAERVSAEWEARHDVAARGHRPSPDAVQQYLVRAHLQDSRRQEADPAAGAAAEPSPLSSQASGGGRRRRVVVGIDGSAASRTALQAALAAAIARAADVEVVSAYPVVGPWTGDAPLDVPDLEEVRTHTEALARALVAEVLEDADLPGSDSLRIFVLAIGGPAADVLISRSQDAELLVVGSRGRGAVRSALLGSVALHCITHARCPVHVVHEAATGEPGRIVVGMDGSPASEAALRVALEEAARTRANVDAVAAFSVGDYWSDVYVGELFGRAQIRRQLQATTEALVQKQLRDARWQEGATPTARTLVIEGPAAEVLTQQAHGAQMLVIGSRGHSVIRGLLLGSVALRCAMHAPCPVLVVHPDPEEGLKAGYVSQPLAARS